MKTLKPCTADHMKRANAHFDACEYGLAINEYTAALVHCPTAASALINRGIAKYKLQNYHAAADDLKAAKPSAKNMGITNYYLGLIEGVKGNHQAAIFHFTRAMSAAKPNFSADIQLKRAYAWFALRNYANALADIAPILTSPTHAGHASQLVNLILDSITCASPQELFANSKKTLFFLIQISPIDRQPALIKQCLNPYTALGARMWRQEGLFPCSLNHGILEELISYYRKQFDPQFMRQDPNPASTSLNNINCFWFREPQLLDNQDNTNYVARSQFLQAGPI